MSILIERMRDPTMEWNQKWCITYSYTPDECCCDDVMIDVGGCWVGVENDNDTDDDDNDDDECDRGGDDIMGWWWSWGDDGSDGVDGDNGWVSTDDDGDGIVSTFHFPQP